MSLCICLRLLLENGPRLQGSQAGDTGEPAVSQCFKAHGRDSLLTQYSRLKGSTRDGLDACAHRVHLATAKKGAHAMRWLCTYGPRAVIMPASSNRFSSPVKGDGNGGRQWFLVLTALSVGKVRLGLGLGLGLGSGWG